MWSSPAAVKELIVVIATLFNLKFAMTGFVYHVPDDNNRRNGRSHNHM
jgi:hypothetical protein